MIDENRGNTLPALVKQISELNFSNSIEHNKILKLSEFVFKELESIRAKYRGKIFNDTKINKKTYAKYEAEEELIIGLLFLLNEKAVNYIVNLKNN